jgi:hypothetical protein
MPKEIKTRNIGGEYAGRGRVFDPCWTSGIRQAVPELQRLLDEEYVQGWRAETASTPSNLCVR